MALRAVIRTKKKTFPIYIYIYNTNFNEKYHLTVDYIHFIYFYYHLQVSQWY